MPAECSEEAFITEHYWGYTIQRDGRTAEYQVEHPRWPVVRATRASLDCDVRGVFGPEVAAFLRDPPSSAFIATGSAVTVRHGVRL